MKERDDDDYSVVYEETSYERTLIKYIIVRIIYTEEVTEEI